VTKNKTSVKERFRFQFCPAVELGPHYHTSCEYSSYKLCKLACDAVAIYTLSLHDFSAMKDYSNFSFIEHFEDDGIWVEFDVDDEDKNDYDW